MVIVLLRVMSLSAENKHNSVQKYVTSQSKVHLVGNYDCLIYSDSKSALSLQPGCYRFYLIYITFPPYNLA